MRISILGTGGVGRTLAEKLVELGHDVMVGTRDPKELLAREPHERGGPSFAQWHSEHPVALGGLAEAAAHGDIVINATAGTASLEALGVAGEENLSGKVLIDVANPLDFSGGFPPSLSVCNTDSLGEQIQREFPGARVVKTLNTVNASIMVDPTQVPGDHANFMSGNDDAAKAEVTSILNDFGWKQVIDLGDITGARAQEMYLPLWLKLIGTIGDPRFNVSIAR